MRDNRIVMMDEATANIDNETDSIIQSVVRTYFRESTVLIIAHRLRSIVHCDEVIVMDKGECREKGCIKKLGTDERSLFREYIENCDEEEKDFILSELK